MRLAYLDDNGQFRITDNTEHKEEFVILSHTWGADGDEVTFQDVQEGTGKEKAGWVKLQFIAQKAKEAKLKYFWVDTCCIDKRNDAEIATAIRSMFDWYVRAKVCYVFLQDVSAGKRDRDGTELWRGQFKACRWLKRGWTLQELLATKSLQFYAGDTCLGDRTSLCGLLHEVTGIDKSALQGQSLDSFTHHTRLQWASRRETKIAEDMAYCLMGLCGVSMSSRYGEGGPEARRRLERKIVKRYGEAALDADARISLIDRSDRATLLDRLRFDVMDDRKRDIKKALKTTCAWLLTHPTFQTWIQPTREHHGFFWIKGHPGTGKSVSIRFLDLHMTNSKEKDDICISFYFHARGESIEKNFLGLYRTLLMQLLMVAPELQSVLDNVRANFENSVDALQTAFSEACLRLGQRRLYCFIDALDECKEEDVSQMIDFFQDLGQDAAENNTSILICFASRHYPIVEVPTRLQLVLEETDQHSKDLERYARHHLRLGNTKQGEQVIADILVKANGIFLWVALVVEILKKEFSTGRVHAVKARLASIPTGLKELFRDIVLRDQEHLDEFLLCLQWVLYAKRPLKLPEFYFAMMAGIDTALGWDEAAVTLDQMHRFLLSSSKGLAELTKGKLQSVQFIHESVRDFLLAKNGFDDIVPGHHVTRAESHERLKQCCIRGMHVSVLSERMIPSLKSPHQSTYESPDIKNLWKPSVEKGKRLVMESQFPFFEYATKFILHHSNDAADEMSQTNFLASFDIHDWLYKANFWESHDINLYKPPLSIVYICAERDLSNLIAILDDQGQSLLEWNQQRYRSPIVAAVSNSCPNALRVLLERTGSTEVEEIVREVFVDKPKGSRPYRYSSGLLLSMLRAGHLKLVTHLLGIEWPSSLQGSDLQTLNEAIRQGSHEIVKVLLRWSRQDKGPVYLLTIMSHVVTEIPIEMRMLLIDEISSHTENQTTRELLLEEASRAGHVTVVKVLLDQYAVVNGAYPRSGRSLIIAAAGGHVEVVQLLLSYGADVNLKDTNDGYPLISATEGGHLEIVRLLLEHGAYVDIRDRVGRTSLWSASNAGRFEIANLLLEHGANVHIMDMNYSTPLGSAISGGHTEVVRLLLEHGASTNTADTRSIGPIYLASWRGGIDIVRLLIAAGADVSAHGGDYGYALHAASSEGHMEIVRLLLSAGADVNAADGPLDYAALHAASSKGHVEIVRLLLSAGAEVNAGQSSALRTASKAGHIEVVRLLIDAGADVCAQRCSALHAALTENHIEIERLLIHAGAQFVADDIGYTMRTAIQRGRVDIVRHLIAEGATMNAQEIPRWIDYDVGAMEQTEMKALLQEHGIEAARMPL